MARQPLTGVGLPPTLTVGLLLLEASILAANGAPPRRHMEMRPSRVPCEAQGHDLCMIMAQGILCGCGVCSRPVQGLG